MPFLTPKYVHENSKSLKNVQRCNLHLAALGSDHRVPSPGEENDFWTDMLVEFAGLGSKRNIEKAIYKRMRKLVASGEANFFIAFRYFWNRAKFLERKSNGFVGDFDVTMFHEPYVSKSGERLTLAAELVKTPIELVPNLVALLLKVLGNQGDGDESRTGRPGGGPSRRTTARKSPEKTDLLNLMTGSCVAVRKHRYVWDLGFQPARTDGSNPAADQTAGPEDRLRDGYLKRAASRPPENVATPAMILKLASQLDERGMRQVERVLEGIAA